MDDLEANLERQRELYGLTLAERCSQLMATYALSQRSLATVLGLSAPMLSQLISGRRIKIGNPAVYGRMQLLEARAQEADLQEVMRQVQASNPATTHVPAVAASRQDVAAWLAAAGPRPALRAAAAAARAHGAVALASVLEEAAGSEMIV